LFSNIQLQPCPDSGVKIAENSNILYSLSAS
jgi:hypothetical protein